VTKIPFIALVTILGGSLAFAQGYPRDAYGNVGIPVVAAFQGADTSTATATLPAIAGRTTYVCGINVNGLGATSNSVVNVAVGPLSGNITFNFQYVMPAGNNTQATPMSGSFSPCLAANAQNTAIVVTVTGAAGNTSTQINVYGYQL